MDINLIEKAIRPLAIGRKNYLLCQDNDATENSAVMNSLLGCCTAHDVNSFFLYIIDFECCQNIIVTIVFIWQIYSLKLEKRH